jgi:uncharacterized Zn finger protein
MEKEVECPWCGKKAVPKIQILKKEKGNVGERRCTSCGKVLAAYLVEEGNFMKNIRKFENEGRPA